MLVMMGSMITSSPLVNFIFLAWYAADYVHYTGEESCRDAAWSWNVTLGIGLKDQSRSSSLLCRGSFRYTILKNTLYVEPIAMDLVFGSVPASPCFFLRL